MAFMLPSAAFNDGFALVIIRCLANSSKSRPQQFSAAQMISLTAPRSALKKNVRLPRHQGVISPGPKCCRHSLFSRICARTLHS